MITPQYINSTIQIRGVITIIRSEYFRIQEYDSSSISMPSYVTVKYELNNELNVNDYVKVVGNVIPIENKTNLINRIRIDATEVVIISQDEADLHLNNHLTTFFSYENLKEITKSSATEMIDFLQTYANKEGFRLVRKHSINEKKNKIIMPFTWKLWEKKRIKFEL